MSSLIWAGGLFVCGTVAATIVGIFLTLRVKWWQTRTNRTKPSRANIELVEETEKPAASRPRVFDIGTVFSIAGFPLSKTPRDHGLAIRYQLGDQLVRHITSWSLNNHTTDLTDGEIEALLRRGNLRPAAREELREERVLMRMALPPVAWSVRTEGAGADDVDSKAPVVQLLKKEGPRTSRYDRILDEDEEESAPQELKDP